MATVTTPLVSSARVPRDNGEVKLPDGYEPHLFDVICKRDRESILHIGNHRFRLCVEVRVDSYLAARSRTDKSLIIQEIIDAVHNCGGRFIRQEDQVASNDGKLNRNLFGPKQDNYKTCTRPIYFDIGTKKASDKVGHAMRLAIGARENPTTKNSSRRQSWPAPTICNSAAVKKAKRRNSTCQETMRFDKRAMMKGPSDVPIPSVVSLNPHEVLLTGLAPSDAWIPRAIDIPSSGINWMPMREATTMSSMCQDRNAGGSLLHDENRHVATTMMRGSSKKCSSDVSLSSEDWDLGEFQVEEADAYSAVLGSTLSCDDCHTIKYQGHQQGACALMHEPPRGIAVSPVLVSQAIDFDDDHNFPWSDYLFDNGGESL